MKKILSMILVFCMVFAMAPTGAYAADIASGDGYSYNEETNVLTITANAGATYTSPWREAYKDSVISVIVEDGVTKIGDSAFSKCSNLTSVHIGDGTTIIGSNALIYCSKLESVHFGKSFTTFGIAAIVGNPKLTTFTVDEENTSYKAIDNVLFTADGKTLVRYPEGKADEIYAVPNSVETIDFRAFYENIHIKDVILTDSVTRIGDTAFYNCKNLTMISLGRKLETIGNLAFAGCSKLSSIDFPSTLTSIGRQAFATCKSLVTVTIPEGIGAIGDYTFYACLNLETVIMEKNSAPTLGTDVFKGSTKATIYTPIGATGYDGEGWSMNKVIEGRAGLSNLLIGYNWALYTLTPTFSTAVTSYSVSIANRVKTLKVYPTIGSGTSVTVNGETVIGDSSGPVSLDEGVNNITVVVENSLYPSESKTYTILVTRASLSPEPTPNAGFIATGSSTGTLTNVSNGMKYSVDEGVTWLSINGTITNITGVTAAKGVQIKRIGNGISTSDSAVQAITITQADAPSGISNTNETSVLDDGTISGVSNLMEYKKSGNISYTTISGSRLTGLVPGEYLVRVKAIGTVLASSDVSVTIAAFTKSTPITNDLDYDLTAVNYDGTVKQVSVMAGSGKTLGNITVKYNGSITEPINAGTYSITVDIDGNAEYKPVTGLSLGDYIINKVAYTGTTAVSASVLVSGQAEATLMLPSLPVGASYGTVVTGGAIAMTDMSIAGTTLTYTAPASTAGQTGTIMIPVTGASNYNDYNIVVSVTYTAKTPQVISYVDGAVVKTYGDGKFTNPLTQTTVNGTITYVSDNTSVVTVNPATGEVTIASVGDVSATITATAEETDTHAQAMASYTVTVAQKTLILKAEDRSMTKGNELPAFTYTITGLLNGDAVTTAPTMSTTTDGTAVGTFDITISGGVVENAACYNITYLKGALTVAEGLFTATVTNGTGSGSYAEGATVTITANDRGGYTFTGWSGTDVTFADATTKTTTFTMPANSVTVTANYRQNSSSNDNSSSVIVTPPALDKPNSPTQGEIKVTGKVDKKGNVTMNITDKTVTDTFDKALADAKKNGNEENGVSVVLHVETGSKNAFNVTVNLPKNVQDIIIKKKIVNTIVVVDNPDISIGMDLATVKEINKQAKSDVNITATRMNSGKLTDNAKKAIGSRPVFDLKVNYGKGKSVQNFGTGNVSVTIPYTFDSNEKVGNVQAVYVDGKGKVHWLVNSDYDSEEQVLRFSTDHFSTYGVGYKQINTGFKDIADHPAKEDVEFVISRGLLSGTSTTAFKPNSAITRGMFVTALGRLVNADVSGYKKSSFTDVKKDAYYMGYIEWASNNNIVTDNGNGTFTPNQSITREQMAVIMQNYAKAIGFTLPKVYVESTFEDSAKISAYAKDAVKQMQMAGVISSKNDNLFDPLGIVTRAEVSAVLHRFVKLIISRDTMQGWSQNDAGEWLYYKDGKPLTGWQDIGSGSKKKTYYFNDKGNLISDK